MNDEFIVTFSILQIRNNFFNFILFYLILPGLSIHFLFTGSFLIIIDVVIQNLIKIINFHAFNRFFLKLACCKFLILSNLQSKILMNYQIRIFFKATFLNFDIFSSFFDDDSYIDVNFSFLCIFTFS
jgi:hypothetical protein